MDTVQITIDNDEYENIFMFRNIQKVNGYILDDIYHVVLQYD